jgi:hypothetical protein
MSVNAFRTMKPPEQRTTWQDLSGKALHLARLGRAVKEALCNFFADEGAGPPATPVLA